jgi:hypothetical protein
LIGTRCPVDTSTLLGVGLADGSTVAPGRRLVDALGLPGGVVRGVLDGAVAVMVTVGTAAGGRWG